MNEIEISLGLNESFFSAKVNVLFSVNELCVWPFDEFEFWI